MRKYRFDIRSWQLSQDEAMRLFPTSAHPGVEVSWRPVVTGGTYAVILRSASQQSLSQAVFKLRRIANERSALIAEGAVA